MTILKQNNMNLQRITATEAMSIGKAFAESGMFPDIKSAAQAIVKIQAGQEIGIPPFAAMSGIHIIQGKPTIGAGVMASCVKGSGKYDYRVIEATEKIKSFLTKWPKQCKAKSNAECKFGECDCSEISNFILPA